MNTEVSRVLYHAETKADKIALRFKKQTITYGELGIKIKETAARMIQKGIGAEDYVLLSAPSRIEYIVAYLALHYIGAIVVPMNKISNEQHVDYIYKQFEVRCFITDEPKMKTREGVLSLTELCNGEEISYDGQEMYVPADENMSSEILFTTGTTGNPKGAVFSYKGIVANTYNTVVGSKMQEDEVVLLPVPLNHSFGLRIMRTALYVGATIVLQSGFMFAKELETNINEYHCTCMACVPSALQIIYQQAGERYAEFLGKLRYIEFSTGALDVATRKKLAEALPETKIINSWGSTETGGVLFIELHADKEKISSAGIPVGGVKIKVVDDSGNEIVSSKDCLGRLAMSGDMIMKEYCNNPELTRQTIQDGWIYTNDLSYIDEDGFVYLLGRVDDIINVGGEKVAPIEVEKYTNLMPGINSSACIGVEDPKKVLGQVPVVYLVKEDQSITEEDVKKYCGGCMPSYMVPQYVNFVSEIPRNYLGKLDRKELKKWWDTGMSGEIDTTLDNEIIRNMMTRRSVRSFTDKPVERKYIEKMLECARFAPSGHNMQTWRFTVIEDAEKIARLKELTKNVAAQKGTSFYGFMNPKVLIVVSNDRRNVCAVHDSACAIENIMLAANSYGIGSCWLNSWIAISDEACIREEFNAYKIPDTHIVYGIVALGYPNGSVKTPAKKNDVIVYLDEGDK